MRSYLAKMTELGLDKRSISKNLQKSVKEFEEGEAEYQELKTQLGQLNPEDEHYDALNSEVEEYEALLNTADIELTQGIVKYAGNKEMYDAKISHMKKVSAEKKAAAAAGNPAPAASAAPANSGTTVLSGSSDGTSTTNIATGISTGTTVSLSSNGTVPASNNPAMVIIDPNAPPAPKKDNGNWLLWGGLAVLGLFVGVNVMKNRE